MKQKDLNGNSYNDINSLPKNQRDLVVNKTMIQQDSKCCDKILNTLLKEEQDQELKKNLLAQERALLRGKLRERHNKTHELEEKCGVRIGSVVNLLKRDESHQKDDLLTPLACTKSHN
jgi:hypothetical protein